MYLKNGFLYRKTKESKEGEKQNGGGARGGAKNERCCKTKYRVCIKKRDFV